MISDLPAKLREKLLEAASRGAAVAKKNDSLMGQAKEKRCIQSSTAEEAPKYSASALTESISRIQNRGGGWGW